MAQRPVPRHVLIRSPSAGSGLRPHQGTPPNGPPCSSVLYIPTGGGEDSASSRTAARPTECRRTSADSTFTPSPPNMRILRPAPASECHRTGLQMSVNVDEPPPLPPRQTQPPIHATRLFASPRPQPRVPTHSPARSMVMNSSGGATAAQPPSITCRDNVLEIRPASGDCCVRVNAGIGGKVRIKIPSTQQSSRVTRFRIADSLKLYGEAEGQSSLEDGSVMYRNPDYQFASPPASIRYISGAGVGIRRERRPSDEAALAAARARKRYSYAFEGDHEEEALHESRIDNFVLESLNEVCDTSVKSESKILHILANKIEKHGPEAGNLWTAFSIPELLNFMKILEIEERDMKKAVILKYKLLKYRISKLMSAQRKLSQ